MFFQGIGSGEHHIHTARIARVVRMAALHPHTGLVGRVLVCCLRSRSGLHGAAGALDEANQEGSERSLTGEIGRAHV